MESMATGLQIQGGLTETVLEITNQANLAASALSVVGGMNVSAVNASYMSLSQTICKTERYIQSNVTEQENLSQAVEKCLSPAEQVGNALKGWQKGINVAKNVLGTVKGALERVGVMDISGAFGRIDAMNQFKNTVSAMTGDSAMADAALEKLKDATSGTAYGMDVAGKAAQGFLAKGMGLGAATEQVRVWADAVSYYGNGTNEQLEGVLGVIGTMYSSGKVEADQLGSLFNAGIDAATLYASATGEGVEKVKEDLSTGAISAAQFIDTIGQAMDSSVSAGAAKDGGSTWASTFAGVQSSIAEGWANIITNLDSQLASQGLPTTMEMIYLFGETVGNVLNTVAENMDWIVGAASTVGGILGSAGSIIAENWGLIASVLAGVAAAWLVYNVAVIGASIAQWAMNTALFTCPITWIAVGIGILIALVLALANHFSGAGHVAQTVFGAICGAINVVNQFIKNFGLTIANIAIGIWNAFGALCNNLVIAFHNAIANTQKNFYLLLSVALLVVTKICEALNKLPFVEFDYSGIANQGKKYAIKAQEAEDSKKEYKSPGDAFKSGMNTFDVWEDGWAGKAYKEGAGFGDGLSGKLKKYLSSKGEKKGGKKSDGTVPYDTTDLLGKSLEATVNTANNTENTANNTASTAKNAERTADLLAVTNEDLKYVRDMAEADYINRFTTAHIIVNQTNHNMVNSNMDLDDVTEHLRTTMEEQMDAAAEGVH